MEDEKEPLFTKSQLDDLALAGMEPGDYAKTSDGRQYRMNDKRQLIPNRDNRAQRRRNQKKARK